MRIGRFQNKTETFYGMIEGNKVLPLDDPFVSFRTRTEKIYNLEELEILAPCQPSKAICMGLNYRDHAEEFKLPLPEEPLIFLKPSTSVIGPLKPIVYAPWSHRVDYEAELAVVIKKTAHNIREKEAAEYILGYTCANDVTARDLQGKDKQWTRAKSFDTFCPLGPHIETDLDPDNQEIFLYLNGELKQHSFTNQLIFPVASLVVFISKVMTLLPGDVILTGTPSGVGRMKPGDIVEVVISGIGCLKNQMAPAEEIPG